MGQSFDQIVITGAALATSLGLTRRATWLAVREGRRGMGPMSAMESPVPTGAEGGQVAELPSDFAPDLPREARYLRRTVLDALEDAGIPPSPALLRPHRRGIVLGTTLHGMRGAGRSLRSADYAPLKDFLAGAVMRNAVGDLSFDACAITNCSACSSSLGAIALSATLLQAGECDVIVAGGYDTISEYVYGGFSSLRLVAPGPLRPFSRGREGMKLAEGYGIVVLERAELAAARGALPLAAILGCGESSDAHHLTQPHPQGDGAARAMLEAIENADLTADDIDLIAAHATGTPDNDAAEFAAMSRVFGDRLARVPVIAFKSHLGHTLGGAGAVELILSAMALRDQVVPPCANVNALDVEFAGLQLATGAARPARIRTTLNTSLGFGGANTCIVLGGASPRLPRSTGGEHSDAAESVTYAYASRARTERASGVTSAPLQSSGPRRARCDVLITGIGVIFPGTIGNDAFVARLTEPRPLDRDTGEVADEQIASLLNARRVRRMSAYVKLSLAATALCLRDAGVGDDPEFLKSAHAVLGTTHGSTGYCEAYYRQIVEEGIGAANPMLFAEGVPNAAAAHLSLMLSMQGSCQTIIGARTAGLDAIRLAHARIAGGQWERAIVGAAEEYSSVVNAAYARWGLHGTGGFVAGAGAVTFLLESRESLESRHGRSRGRVTGAAGAITAPSRMSRLARRLVDQLGIRDVLVNSSNGTWLDRVESAVKARSSNSPYGMIAECASALPLAGIAAVLLTGQLPCQDAPCPAIIERFTALATDYAGFVSAIGLERTA